ncbi:hypothetical protein [Streptomyces sp. NPDC051576]|uniref:hypothetical protein n=1 Tax=Streptomyces sp. NPDC051576 TaxID=3155803 RepID=UPI003449F153
MSTITQQPVRLPSAAIPDGCAGWDEEHARAWAEGAVPWWVPVRPRRWAVELAVWCALLVVPAVLTTTDLPPELIALLPLQVVWWLWRPEAVRLSAPLLIVVVAVRGTGLSWPVLVCAALLVLVPVTATELRARARARQRHSALAAAGGVTASLPDADGPVRRGVLLLRLGAVLAVPGVVLLCTSGLWADDRPEAVATGLFLAGLALTLILSGALGRRRAVALRRAPAPVLRVLVRKDAHGDAVVFAADDPTALRPLFTVPVMEHADDKAADEDAEAELDEFLDGSRGDEHGPLREAVLYGTPCDGAEVLLVSASPKPGEPPVTEWSTGPVRPVSEHGLRRRLAREKRAVERAARADAEHQELVEAARGLTPVPARRWRAGPVDWLSTFLVVQWAGWVLWIGSDPGLWNGTVLFVGGLAGAALVPRKLCWRITADSTGIWLNGLRRPRHVLWDDLRSARREAFELKLRVRDGDHWDVSAPRWPWLQRKRGLTHPYDALAAELSAMIDDPALRPTGESGERERGRPLWPFAAVLGIAWVALLVTRWLS